MAYFKITYGISNDAYEDYIEAKDLDDARDYAYQQSIATYETMEGLHGIPDVYEIAYDLYADDEEYEGEYTDFWDTLDDEQQADAFEQYYEERESWLSYDAEEVTRAEFDAREEILEEEDEEEEEIVKKQEYLCPKCGKDYDLQTEDYDIDLGDNLLVLEMYCPHCEESWKEYFKLKYDGYSSKDGVWDENGEYCGV